MGTTLTTDPAANPTGADGSANSSPSTQTFIVKVNGEDHEVTLEELQAGYSREADYRRKTQDLANQRKELARAQALADALERNPREALETIQKHYGIEPVAATQPQVGYDEDTGTIETTAPSLSPEVEALRGMVEQLQSQLRSVATTQQASKLEGELGVLGDKYGEFDREQVLRHMQANGLPSLEVAYRDLHFEELHSAAAAKAEAEQQVLDAKRAQAGLVAAGGSSADGSAQPITQSLEGMDLGDALAAALGETLQDAGVADLSDPVVLWGD